MRLSHLSSKIVFINLIVILFTGILGMLFLYQQTAQKNTAAVFKGTGYSVMIPETFYIYYRSGDDFSAANKKWEGKSEYYPSIDVRTYNGAIPRGMKLRDWLEHVGSIHKWSEFSNVSIPCKTLKDSLRKEINNASYGGDDGKLRGDECLFFSIDGVADVTLPHISDDKRLPDLEIIEFTSTGPASSGFNGTYTLITYGTGKIIQISKKKTSLSDANDGIDEAYQVLKDSIRIN